MLIVKGSLSGLSEWIFFCKDICAGFGCTRSIGCLFCVRGSISLRQEGWRNCLGVQGVPKSFPSVGWFLNEPGQEEWALTPGGGGVGETTGVTAEMKSCPQVMSRGAVVKAVEVYF